ncbi:DnaJ-like membrane chaperone protein (N-terminal terB-like domain) [Campylobacter iguaniorum]|uniref:DnaJ domain-containing protein n=1 Tax=Campylobacter iguaniorum TaxID=1244531 RepID=UPI0007C93A21|nr:DnaJ domain-containing protein [Campylobacter iguaniorum]ANE35609.1 DnaJ-like membrane chaperone protein (N-terminal terB-like domain) [Campylobacter iguaniorum]
MNVFLILIAAIVIFYALSKGYLKNPALQGASKFDLNDAKYIIKLLAKIAKSDGNVSKEEAYYISIVLDDICLKLGNSAIRQELKDTFNAAKQSKESAFGIALEYKTLKNLDTRSSVNLIIFLLNLAYADGEFSSAKRDILNEICDGLGVDKYTKEGLFAEFDKEFKAKFQTQISKDPYEILGLSKDASFEEIKKQYRKLARDNHPDFLAGSGADEKLISEATKKLQEINEAYEILKKEKA